MTHVTKGLVIDGHWVSLILAGRKIWEMRSQITQIRGTIGLIRKGTGQVSGVANLVDCLAPLSPEEMIANVERHQIPESRIRSGEVDKWRFPWVLEDPVGFADPVTYEHPSGAVIWVQLDEKVSEQIDQRLNGGGRSPAREAEPPNPVRRQHSPPKSAPLSEVLAPLPASHPEPSRAPMPNPSAGIIGRTEITEGNLKHNHIYLRHFFDKFPADAVGGRTAARSPRNASTCAGGIGVARNRPGRKEALLSVAIPRAEILRGYGRGSGR